MSFVTDFLSSLGEEVDFLFDNVNYGGCCVYASIVGKHLKKLGMQVRGKVVGGRFDHQVLDVDRIRRRINIQTPKMIDWSSEGLCFNHVAVSVFYEDKWLIHDTTNTEVEGSDFGGRILHKGSLTTHDLTCLAMETGWNPDFDRAQIPDMTQFIGYEFNRFASEYSKRHSVSCI